MGKDAVEKEKGGDPYALHSTESRMILTTSRMIPDSSRRCSWK
jgi:hypothetical protein